MSAPDEIDMLAAEFVVGTLDGDERQAVAERRVKDAVLDAAIVAWERRLAGLDAATAPVVPTAGLFAQVERRLESVSRPGASVVELGALRRRVRIWKTTAVAALATAASLMLFVVARETVLRPTAGQTFVGVFADGDVLPKFYLTIDLDRREMTVRPVGAERLPDRTYQLWIASDRIGPRPQSLGLVDDALGPTRRSLADFDVELLRRATFGVSVEPLGGSPTGQPSPGALHTKLLPAAL